MKNVGIATFYKNSVNYGGILQSYALCQALNSLGYKAQQISYTGESRNIIKRIKCGYYSFSHFSHRISSAINRKKTNDSSKKISELIHSFDCFKESIPHTSENYNGDSIFTCNYFDVYITGSDQVWNLGTSLYLSPFYWLYFVDSEKIKISYAASTGMKTIPPKKYKEIRNALKSFNSISVREKNDVHMINQIIGENRAKWVVDPVFLIQRYDWLKIKKENPFANEKYIFAYLLGDSESQRHIITEFAKHKGLKIITIPYLLLQYRKCDDSFGDVRCSNVSPDLWLSLVDDAEYVFTDSFHGCAFSLIFQKKFFAFKRFRENDPLSMNSRINSLLELFNITQVLLDDNESVQSIKNRLEIDYNRIDSIIEKERNESIDFLIESIERPSLK